MPRTWIGRTIRTAKEYWRPSGFVAPKGAVGTITDYSNGLYTIEFDAIGEPLPSVTLVSSNEFWTIEPMTALSTRDRILEYLWAWEYDSIAGISTELGIKRGTVSSTVRRLMQDDLVCIFEGDRSGVRAYSLAVVDCARDRYVPKTALERILEDDFL